MSSISLLFGMKTFIRYAHEKTPDECRLNYEPNYIQIIPKNIMTLLEIIHLKLIRENAHQ